MVWGLILHWSYWSCRYPDFKQSHNRLFFSISSNPKKVKKKSGPSQVVGWEIHVYHCLLFVWLLESLPPNIKYPSYGPQ